MKLKITGETDRIILHAEGTAMLNTAFHYIEQQPNALPHDVLFLKNLRDTNIFLNASNETI